MNNSVEKIKRNSAELFTDITYDAGGQVTKFGADDFTYDTKGNYKLTNFGLLSPMNAYEKDQLASPIGYDFIGNPLALNGKTLNWDINNRLKSATGVEFTYDSFGRKLMRIQNQDTINYVYSGWQVIEEIHNTTVGQATRAYTYGSYIDEVVSLTLDSAGTSSTYYLHQGLNQNVEAVSNSSGSLVEKYDVDAWGKFQILNSSSVVITQSQIGNTRVFQGLEYDSDLKSFYARYRWYNPEMGRFVNRDPERYDAQDINLYRFVGNNPVNGVDPFGLFTAKEGKDYGLYPDENGVLVWHGITQVSYNFTGFKMSDEEGETCCTNGKNLKKHTYSYKGNVKIMYVKSKIFMPAQKKKYCFNGICKIISKEEYDLLLLHEEGHKTQFDELNNLDFPVDVSLSKCGEDNKAYEKLQKQVQKILSDFTQKLVEDYHGRVGHGGHEDPEISKGFVKP